MNRFTVRHAKSFQNLVNVLSLVKMDVMVLIDLNLDPEKIRQLLKGDVEFLLQGIDEVKHKLLGCSGANCVIYVHTYQESVLPVSEEYAGICLTFLETFTEQYLCQFLIEIIRGLSEPVQRA